MTPFESIRKRMAGWIGGAVKASGVAQIVRLVSGHNEPVWPRLDIYDQQATEYLRSSWVYVAVTRIAEAAALVPYEVYATKGEAKIAQQNHAIEQLLRNPNPHMSQWRVPRDIDVTFE